YYKCFFLSYLAASFLIHTKYQISYISKPSSFLKLSTKMLGPNKQDQQVVPITNQTSIQTLQDLRGFLGINNVGEDDHNHQVMHNSDGHDECLSWELTSSSWEVDQADNTVVKKQEVDNTLGFWGESSNNNNNAADETNVNLNLNLNHDQLLEAWSNRGSLWANNNNNHHHPCFSASKNPYLGEVPNLEDETRSRESSVVRYKEKRQTRLFANKIRYQVRKMNADNRPRHKVSLYQVP
ncbi:hypothetical protein KSS87_007722, partial [Heliosperma pusillum]